jgi:acetyltransferase
MARTRIAAALHGIRGRRPVDERELERLLVRFSDLVLEQPGIKEIDINPLLASPKGFLALDARVVLREFGDGDAPKPAIRPYPREYSKSWHFEDGSEVIIRPIRPEDEPAVAQFHKRLSEQTVYNRYFRFFNLDQRVEHNRLSNICFSDFDRNIVLVAERGTRPKVPKEILAVARLNRIPFTDDAELAVLIEDDCQNRGLGTELVRRLTAIARKEKISRITLETRSGNTPMIELCKQLGITLQATGAGILSGAVTLQ